MANYVAEKHLKNYAADFGSLVISIFCTHVWYEHIEKL